MDLIFRDEDMANGIHILEFEDLVFTCEAIEQKDDIYVMTGKAEVDGEIYHGFQVAFSVVGTFETLAELLQSEWDWYDYV